MKKALTAVKDEFRVRKAIALLLLIAAAAFLVLNTDSLYYTNRYFGDENASKHNEVYEKSETMKFTGEGLIPAGLEDGTVISMDFDAEESKIQDIRLMFSNEMFYEAPGSVTATLTDSKGKVLGSSTIESNQIRHMKFTVFSFITDSDVYNNTRIIQSKNQMPKSSDGIPVTKGDRYTISVTGEGMSAEDGMALFLMQQDDDDTAVLSVDGSDVDDQTVFGFITYSIFSYPILVFLLAVLFLTALMAVFPWEAVNGAINAKRSREKDVDIEVWVQRLVFIATPAVCFWINYKITDNKLTEILQLVRSLYGPMNLAILTGLLLVIYVITNSKRVASGLTVFLTMALATSCYFLILFRDIPLRACDFADIGTAADVAANYEFVISKSLMWIATISVCVIALNFSFKRSKGLSVKPRIALLAAVCVLCGSVYWMITDSDYSELHGLQIKGFNQSGQYRVKGYALGFTISFRDMHIKKPEGYSVEEAEKIAADYKSDKASANAKVSEESPNVIVIMNEAFSDLSVLGKLETNTDYMPFFRSLEDNTIRGNMHVSTFGGGTAKTEFEFLTGNTDAFLKFKTAYTNLIKDDAPSLARTLSDQGYKGMTAFHPGKYDSYNRNNVYPFFGFEKYISIDDLDDPDKIREYVSDKACYDTIINEYETYKSGGDSDAPFFLFNVTIQNHGGFSYSTGVVDAGIEITDPELKLEAPQQFLNLIKESDNAFEELINYFENCDEPTVVVMFGDHQPGIGTEFYEVMARRASKDLSEVERIDRRYKVPFVIWANYDIEEEQDVDISANMLSAYMLDKIGLKMTGYDKFLLDLHKRIPSLSSIAYYDSKGNAYEMDADKEEEIEMSDDIMRYHYLQYNNMNKSSERIENFFTLAK